MQTFLKVKKYFQYLTYRHITLHSANPLQLREDDRNFLYVWLVLIAIRIWGTIRFFLRASYSSYNHVTQDVKNADDVLIYFQAIGDPSQAFWNCFMFCVLDKEVRRLFIRMCKRVEFPISFSPARNEGSEQEPLLSANFGSNNKAT